MGCWFKPGDKVVCVLDLDLMKHFHPKLPWYKLHSQLPHKGEVFTVREVQHFSFDPAPAVWLEEIVSREWMQPDGIVREIGFICWLFRPVIESKGMESLFAILKQPKPAKERENA